MAKKLFKKKSFWAKLPTKAKVGVIALVIALVGAGAAYALSQSDASLQSKASLSCEASCQQACGSIRDGAQSKSCMGSCVSKCNANMAKVPKYCVNVERTVAEYKKKGELTKREIANTFRLLKNNKEDLSAGWNPPSEQSILSWYNRRCVVKETCEPNWTRVVDMGRQRPLPSEGDQAKQIVAQPTTARYFWPDGCKGNPPTNGEKRGCTSALVALTQAEVTKYQAWLKAGKPTSNLCGSTSTGTSNCTPLPEQCRGDMTACKLSPYVNWCPTPDPTPSSTCPTPPACKDPQRLVTGDSRNGSCPAYRCI